MRRSHAGRRALTPTFESHGVRAMKTGPCRACGGDPRLHYASSTAAQTHSRHAGYNTIIDAEIPNCEHRASSQSAHPAALAADAHGAARTAHSDHSRLQE
ncbi:unnamed protein product [Pleuronectes platessa]|uniref:Uncharacterized protein n=1 Tax=Pleuronectes platessa TaxID=8262 RepID=A0A9N7YQ85_PLEPL|nr:unnamed protein product [Pleuronectes platessa]